MAAADAFTQIETAAEFFNFRNALAQGQNYLHTVQAYGRALELDPDHNGAQKNRLIFQDIIDDINRMSESQHGESGEQSIL